MPDHQEDLFEFAVSCGEGTLLRYGVTDFEGDAGEAVEEAFKARDPNFTFIMAPATPDCATGK